MTHLIQIIDWVSNISMLLPMLGCVAVWKPKGVQIAKKYLENCFTNNKEGAGFAIVKDGKIEMEKGFFTFDEFWQAYNGLQKYAALIHFRIATHGKVDEDNCHPFMLDGGKYALVHNGVLPSSLHSGKKDESDSRQFGELIEPMLGFIPWHHEQFTTVVNEAIGYNKIALLREDGNIWIFNEGKGEWHKGAWYSNHTYFYGAAKRAWTKTVETVDEMWKRLGYDRATERPQLVYSTVHHQRGFYSDLGEWVSADIDDKRGGYYNLQGDWVQINHWTDSNHVFDEADAVAADANWEAEPSDEELALLAQADSQEQLEGDLEFMPQTEQERIVGRWLAMQEAKVRRVTDAPPSKIVDGGFPDWEPNVNAKAITC